MISSVWKNKNWIKPEIKEELNPNRTTLTLYMKKDSENYTKNYLNKLNKTQLKIIESIRNNPMITSRELTEIIENITLAGVKWN